MPIVAPAEASRHALWQLPRNAVRMLLVGIVAAHAQDGTWTPGSSDWNTASNWTPSTAVPSGIATFGSSTVNTVTFSSSASVGTLQFNAGAPAYSFNLEASNFFNISGAGIVDNSSNAVTFTTSNGGELQFQMSSTAGTTVLITNSTGVTSFENTSTGGQARVITNSGGYFRYIRAHFRRNDGRFN